MMFGFRSSGALGRPFSFLEQKPPFSTIETSNQRRKTSEQYINRWRIRHHYEGEHGQRDEGCAYIREEQLRRSLDVPAALPGQAICTRPNLTTGDDDEMRPTKKGITVRIDDVPKLADALTALVDAVKEQKS
jgi:hypothetical protein